MGDEIGYREVLEFWLETCGPQDWYVGGEALDGTIRHRFGAAWEAARAGRLRSWERSAEGSLALLVLTDQFPRNMFRGEARAFATDALARNVARRALDRGFDRATDEPQRQFFYLPLEHAETLADQERAVRLIATRMDAPETLLHARAHREVIRRFGRFPFRNAALGRTSTAAEQAFLDAGSYAGLVRHLRDDG